MESRNEPIGEIPVDDELISITRDNLSLHRHIAKYAIYDHCYLALGEQKGAYIWVHSPNFERLAKLAEEKQAQITINIPQVSDNDRNFYMQQAMQDFDEAESVLGQWANQFNDQG